VHDRGIAKHTTIELVPGTPLRVVAQSGNVTVTGEERDDVLVARPAKDVTTGPEGVEVSAKSGSVDVRCPYGTDVLVGARSGSVELRGTLGDVRITAESGDIEVERVLRLDARTASGSIDVGDCELECRCRVGSGHVRVIHAGSIDLTAASGSVEADAVGDAQVHAGSGSVTLGLTEVGSVAIDAHSGSVDVTVPAGCRPRTDLRATSGSVRCDCETGNDGLIQVTARSGAITVTER